MSSDAQRFAGQVRAVLDGQFPQGKLLTLGSTPPVLRAVGVPALQLVMRPGKIREILENHNMTPELIIAIPEKLSAPIMIFESGTQENALAVLLDLTDQAGNPVIAAVHIAVRQRTCFVNRLASMYGKDNAPRWITEQIRKGRLLYFDKKKALRLSASTRVQFPGDVQNKTERGSALGPIGIITRKLGAVKEISHSAPANISAKKDPGYEDQ